jgi:ABC-type dipeptide/oligopeptide/nickel transport system permease component
MFVIRKELGFMPDSSATAAIMTATSSPSSTAGAAGAAGLGAGAGAAFLAGAAGAALPSTELTILEMMMITRARMASIINTTTRPHTATIRASGTLNGLNGSRIALLISGIDQTPH